MARRDTRQLKALYFDLRVKDLRRYFSADNPTRAYGLIQEFFRKHSFDHVQYSGYHSTQRLTDIEIFLLIRELIVAYPWLNQCVNRFEVTNIGVNHDLIRLFQDAA